MCFFFENDKISILFQFWSWMFCFFFRKHKCKYNSSILFVFVFWSYKWNKIIHNKSKKQHLSFFPDDYYSIFALYASDHFQNQNNNHHLEQWFSTFFLSRHNFRIFKYITVAFSEFRGTPKCRGTLVENHWFRVLFNNNYLKEDIVSKWFWYKFINLLLSVSFDTFIDNDDDEKNLHFILIWNFPKKILTKSVFYK